MYSGTEKISKAPLAFFRAAQSIWGMPRAQRKGAVERQAERSREGQRGPQVKTTSADRGNHQILSTTLWASIPQLARTDSFTPRQSTGSGCHLVSGYFRQPPTGVPHGKALPRKEQSCQSAGLSPWTGKKEYFQTPFGVWLPHDFQGKIHWDKEIGFQGETGDSVWVPEMATMTLKGQFWSGSPQDGGQGAGNACTSSPQFPHL